MGRKQLPAMLNRRPCVVALEQCAPTSLQRFSQVRLALHLAFIVKLPKLGHRRTETHDTSDDPTAAWATGTVWSQAYWTSISEPTAHRTRQPAGLFKARVSQRRERTSTQSILRTQLQASFPRSN